MIIWAIQIFLAVAFGAAGTMKLVRSQAQLAARSDPDAHRRSVSRHAHGRSRGDAYDAWRVRSSFNDPRRVGDNRGSVPMIVVV